MKVKEWPVLFILPSLVTFKKILKTLITKQYIYWL
jgi:hypothetical protein